MPADKKKAQKSLPPKPSTFSDEQWEVAHSAAKLLELLAAPDKASHSASSKSGDKPVASKPSAALWLCHLLGSSSDACEDAFKGGAVEICSKIISSQSCDAAVLASVLSALSQLANPATGPQAPQVREAIISVRPAVVPALLNLLEQASGSHSSSTGTAHHSSTSAVAAALGLLAILASAPDTRLRVTKLVAGWNMKPLVAALASQQALPLEGGRNAWAEAAAILETICAPAASQAATADSASESKKGGKKGAKGDAEGGKKEAAAPVGDSVDPTLTDAVQQAVLAAEGTMGLLELCAAVASPAAARVSAVAALQHLMAAHGREQCVKAEFAAARGVHIMLKLMMSTTLPLPARAAAAGCIWHYLAPRPADTAAVADDSVSGTAPAAGGPTPAATPVASVLKPQGAISRSIASPEARSNIIATARIMRKQQREGGVPDPAASKGRSSATSSSMSGGGSNTRPSIAAAAAAAATGPPKSSSDTLSLAGQGSATEAAAYQSSVAVWDAAAVAGLAARAEEVIHAGVVPALLVLCCGPEGPPPGLTAAAVRAAATADAAQKAAKAGSAAAGPSAGGSDTTAADSISLRLPAGNGWSGMASEGLGAIAEPSQGEEGAEEDETEDGHATAASAAATGREPAEGKKKGKKGKKGSTKVDPELQTAQSNATAAVNLLALSGDAGRTALQDAGAKAVLVPLLSGPNPLARWSARQALMSLALTSSNKALAKPVSGVAAPKLSSRRNPSGLSNTAAASGNTISDGPAWLIGTESASVPNYIAMSNLPASHYQRSAPISQVLMPVTPAIPKSWGADSSNIPASTGPAGAAGGPAAYSALAGRPGSRRISISNNSGQMTPAGRMSSGSFHNSGAAGGDGQGAGTESSAGARTSGMKGSRGALLATAAAGAAAAGSPDGVATVNSAMQ